MITITGANSFIGKNIIDSLQAYQFKEVDMLDIEPENIDFPAEGTVIHLAAIVHQKKTIPEELYFKVNTKLAIETAKEAKRQGVRHFIFFSTIKVYGDGGYDEIVYNEESECSPVDAYGKSKLMAEQGVLALANDDFKVSIIRPSMVYGAGVKANMLMLAKFVKSIAVVPLGGIENKRSMVSIHNLMITLEAIMKHPQTGIFLACDKEPVSTSELVEKIIEIVSPNKKILRLPDFIISILKLVKPKISRRMFGSFYVDARFTHKKLSISDSLISLKAGLREMLK